ncbi:cysteine desulfurase family protein [Apilactobacillus timberlakei]|uniref:Cysteine desulfurase n=1 Tax=Apilactobacillus timberlakei TaxID=2008380 RepID=A0ABY2YSI8_9LACO|nr:cysteine desulfurase family protein [Apilactobacillus timberlakei]TPR12667.1 cysteine desulfurase [Apilactobacillus timberlakei]TPR13496.1 cysteine desulfurase [Apilactobacillus timberlakei]TPR15569.1 cysteine desulfurase [Apilactobacillus timberlakei]TPR17817.1 cysteine desulfurase [Apilactobacillus timberlakei]TPR18518.1 cysteine desulfurase [Apilactobacillus timberlakei]
MIYFDNSATTKPDLSVVDTYSKVSKNIWGNPSSLHQFGEQSFNLLEQSRQQIAKILNVFPDEIFFTGGGTEGDNWAIKGTAMAKRKYGNHIITSSVEHPAVINSMKQLEKLGFEVTYLPVDQNGKVSVEDVKSSIKHSTILISIMAVNNEVGSIQPIEKIGELLKKYPTIQYHIDAVQGIGKGLHDIIFNDRADLITFSGHKFHAPRGVGFIYKRRGKKVEPLLAGGGQEKNLRSSTENLPAIVAMARALRLLTENEKEKVAKQAEIKDFIFNYISKFDNVVTFSKDNAEFAPHILCFAIKGVRGETIVHAFESYDIFISTTSACSSKKHLTSSTLTAMKIPEEDATSAVRISLDENNTMNEAKKFIQIFDILYEKFKKINA